ncbi:MAG: hypothetical protein ACR2I0_10635, partial [Rhodoferax sp.]
FDLVLEQKPAGKQWTINATNAHLGFAVGAVGLALTGVSGTLAINPDGSRSGTVTGQAALTGVEGLALSGAMSAAFDASGNLSLSGTAALDVQGMATLAGNFVIDRTVLDNRSQLRVKASNLSAFVGMNGVGAQLSNGQLAMLIGNAADGSTGYAIQGSASVTVSTGVLDMTGQVGLVGNTLQRAVNTTISVGNQSLVLAYDGALVPPKIDIGNLDALLTSTLGDAMRTLSTTVVDTKAAITPQYDAGGNATNDNPMARELPVLGTSLSQLIGADKILGIGEYVQRYMLSGSANLTAPDYSTVGVGAALLAFGGTNYLKAPTLTITGGSGTGFAAKAVLIGGVVSIEITNPGKGYYAALPTLTLSGGETTGTTCSNSATLMYPVGAAHQATLRGLLAYLQDNWLPTLGLGKDALKLVMGSHGIDIAFADKFTLQSTTTLRLGTDAEAIGLTLDGDIQVGVAVDVDLAFRLAIDWATGASSFNLERLNVQAQAKVDDIDVTAAIGPLAVSLGDQARQAGSLTLSIGGSVTQSASGWSFTKTADSLEASLPVYAKLGSLDQAAGKVPTNT